MALFLFVYLLIYGGIHGYFYFRLQSAFLLSLPVKLITVLLLAFLVLCPVFVRVAERFGHETAAWLLSYLGYLWMGLVFVFFAASLLLDLYRLLLGAGALVSPHPLTPLHPTARVLFLLPLILSAVVNLYGYVEARQIRMEQLVVRTAKLPIDTGRLRIVQISDVHVGLIVQGERLARMLAVVKEARPDILVSTGDLVDGQIDSIAQSIALLRSIPTRYGKYAVTGNHEFYAGLDQALQITRDAGFRVLRGEAVNVGGLVRLVGVDDPTGRQMGRSAWVSEKDLLAKPADAPPLTILLKHQPVVHAESVGAFDLQLSGHTHRGQIFPFSLITKMFFPFHSGYAELAKGSALYVSRGTGTWGPPVRFLSPPEVTVIDLIPDRKK